MQPLDLRPSPPASSVGAGSGQRRFRDSQLDRQPDAVLVAHARAGSEAAFAEIVRRYERQLQRYCGRVLDPALAKDAVQQTFMRALAGLRSDDPDHELNLRPWLYRLAHWCALDIRRAARLEHDQLDPSLDGVAQPPQIVELHERLDDTIAAMQRLPSSQRRALVARELEGRSYSEISDELGQTDAGVRQLIFRARTALRNGLGAFLPLSRWGGWYWTGGGRSVDAATSWHATFLSRAGAVVLSVGCVALGVTSPSSRSRAGTATGAGDPLSASLAPPRIPPSAAERARPVAFRAPLSAAPRLGHVRAPQPTTGNGPFLGAPRDPARSGIAPDTGPATSPGPSAGTPDADQAPAGSEPVPDPPPVATASDLTLSSSDTSAPSATPPAASSTPPVTAGSPTPGAGVPTPPASSGSQTPPSQPPPPPGQGGTPPGHGGTPPGHGGTPPGHSGTPPGHGGAPPGHGGAPPGHGDAS